MLMIPELFRGTALGSAAVSLRDGSGVGLKCDLCNYIHKGGLRGFWACGKLGPTKMLAVVFAITNGISFRNLKAFGIKISPNTWTGYVRDVGMLLSEELERQRRDPANKFWLAQWDESACGKRKYNQ